MRRFRHPIPIAVPIVLIVVPMLYRFIVTHEFTSVSERIMAEAARAENTSEAAHQLRLQQLQQLQTQTSALGEASTMLLWCGTVLLILSVIGSASGKKTAEDDGRAADGVSA